MNSVGAAIRAFSLRIVLAIVLCAALVAASVVLVNRYIDDQVAKIPRIALTTSPVEPNGMNFLIIGSDSRSFVDNQIDYGAFSDKDTQNAPPRSDTMMVLHANGDNSYAVSFPRDLWVNIPGKGEAKMNSAFNDGPQKVVDTLQADFDLPINHYLEVDFETFEGIVNAIGSVPVWIPGVVLDKETGLYSPFGAGCYRLDGAAALQYVRSRNILTLDPKGTYDAQTGMRWSPLDATADIGRIKRQQDFVKKLGRIAVERALDDPMIAPDIVDAFLPNLHADTAFDRAALNELVRAFLGLASGGTGLQFETLPWDGPATRDRQSVVLVKHPEADTVLARLRGDVVVAPEPTTTAAPSQPVTVRPVDVRVRVLNGSGINGAAGDVDQALSKLGFVSGGVGNNTGGNVTAERDPVSHRRRGQGSTPRDVGARRQARRRSVARRWRRRPRARHELPGDRRVSTEGHRDADADDHARVGRGNLQLIDPSHRPRDGCALWFLCFPGARAVPSNRSRLRRSLLDRSRARYDHDRGRGDQCEPRDRQSAAADQADQVARRRSTAGRRELPHHRQRHAGVRRQPVRRRVRSGRETRARIPTRSWSRTSSRVRAKPWWCPSRATSSSTFGGSRENRRSTPRTAPADLKL